MTDRKTQLFFRAGYTLTALLIIEELFLIISALLFSKKINEIIVCILFFVPFIITYIYSLMSAFEKSRSRLQTLVTGIAGIIICFLAVALLSILPAGLYINTLIGVLGVLLAVYGLVKAPKIFVWGIICVNAASLSFSFISFAMLASHAKEGVRDAVSAIVSIPMFCIFIIADLIVSAKGQKVKENLEA